MKMNVPRRHADAHEPHRAADQKPQEAPPEAAAAAAETQLEAADEDRRRDERGGEGGAQVAAGAGIRTFEPRRGRIATRMTPRATERAERTKLATFERTRSSRGGSRRRRERKSSRGLRGADRGEVFAGRIAARSSRGGSRRRRGARRGYSERTRGRSSRRYIEDVRGLDRFSPRAG